MSIDGEEKQIKSLKFIVTTLINPNALKPFIPIAKKLAATTCDLYSAWLQSPPSKYSKGLKLVISCYLWVKETLYLSPTQRSALSAQKGVLASLAGDFVNYKSFPQLNDRYLSIPGPGYYPHPHPLKSKNNTRTL